MKKSYLILNINNPILITNDFLKAYEYCVNANKGDYDYFQKTVGECINDLQLYNDCSIGKLKIMIVERF